MGTRSCSKSAAAFLYWLETRGPPVLRLNLGLGYQLFFLRENLPQPIQKIFNSLPAHPRNEIDFLPPQFLSQLLNRFIIDRQIRLVSGDDFALLGQLRTERFQLMSNFSIVISRIGPIHRKKIEHVHENFGSLNMPKKIRPQSSPRMRALNQSRNISHHHATTASQFNDPQLRLQ